MTENIGFYSQLPNSVKTRSGHPTTVPVDEATKKFTPIFVEKSVNASLSDIAATTAYKTRVEGRQLLLTNSFKDTPKALLPKGKSSRRTITAKERRALRIYEIPREAQKHACFVPLHRLWTQYIAGVIGDKTGEQMLGRLMRADMHGAQLTVARAKCPNYVGVSGIVAQETKNVFRVITKDDKLATVPKAHCVFALELPSPSTRCLVYGSQFAFRPSDRASKKFKPKPTVDL
ncbi:RNase P/RNase MRP complex subunit [Coemansia sp. RSA 2050]|nr:RNase P/RNase MRP complex subunit [Coemansia sp. RSA 2050]KAJ2733481.1 RNase P/RNase MRP complex subunit [Coemansia sp. BCRC 34962]